jgi:hypothetical protein
MPDAEILQADVGLQEAQYALAMEYGYESWAKLKHYVEALAPRPSLRRDAEAVWIEGLPELRWGQNKECTSCGAMEAALAVTDEPYSYDDLMGFSGMAFRVRTHEILCPSSGVGEMPDEYAAIRRATGWDFPTDVQMGRPDWDRQAAVRKVVASIDAGLPVMAYNDHLDMGVIYGYEQAGQMLWWNEYFHRGLPYKVPADQIGPLQSYLVSGSKRPAMPPIERLRASLQLASLNWRRGRDGGGIPEGSYHYGAAGYDLWIDILQRIDKVDPKDLPGMMHGHYIIFYWLTDARQAAARFLQDHADLLADNLARQMRQTAECCGRLAGDLQRARQEAKLFPQPSPQTGPETWTPDRRKKEIELLQDAKQQDAAIIRQLEGVLSSMEQ